MTARIVIAALMVVSSFKKVKLPFTCAFELMKKSRHVLRRQGLWTPSPQFPPLPISLPLKDVMVWKHLIYPFSPQVIFEATVSEERQGYIALDDIGLLNYPCCKYPAARARTWPLSRGGGKYRVMPQRFKEPDGFAEGGLRLQGPSTRGGAR